MMRTIITIVCLAISLSNFAQDNIVKLGLLGLSNRNINLKYERVLNEKNSINLNVGFKIPGGLPFGLSINDIADGDINVSGDLKVNGISIAPEYRFYTGGNAPTGFYLAPYLQFRNLSSGLEGEVDGYYGDIKFSYGNFGGGLLLGAQWLIKDKVSIDWQFFGIGVNRNTVKLRLESNDPSIDFKEFETDIDESLSDVPILGNKIETTSGDDFGEMKSNFIFPALKGGLSVGIAF